MPNTSTPSLATREPLAIRGAIIAFITAALHLAVMNGWLGITAEIEAQTIETITLGIDLIGIAALVIWGRGKVTPTADPRLPGTDTDLEVGDRG